MLHARRPPQRCGLSSGRELLPQCSGHGEPQTYARRIGHSHDLQRCKLHQRGVHHYHSENGHGQGDGHCVGDNIAYFHQGWRLEQTAVAVFDSSGCSNPPVRITATSVFKCTASRNVNAAACESEGSSRYSVSACPDSDWGYAELMFGVNQPWLRVMASLEPNCGSAVDSVVTYSADGICHSDSNETSYKAEINLEDSTARITTYADVECSLVTTDLELNSYQLTNSPCVSYACANPAGCRGMFSVGFGSYRVPSGSVTDSGSDSSGVSIAKSAKVVYDESTCNSTPTTIIVTDEERCSSPVAPVCENADMKSSSHAHYAVECFDDLEAFATAKLNNTPYVVIETYKEGTDCGIQEGVVVYSADGECHVNVIDGSSFRVRPSIADSITVATYPNALCIDSDADYITMGAKYIDTDACFKGNMKLQANMTAFTAFYADSPVSPPKLGTNVFDQKSREQIMFPEWLWEPKPRRIFESA